MDKKLRFGGILNKTMLAGVSYYTADGGFIRQKQFYGRIVSADQDGISLRQEHGEALDLPLDLSSVKRAAPGVYHLTETGRRILNPDFFAVWRVYKPEI